MKVGKSIKQKYQVSGIKEELPDHNDEDHQNDNDLDDNNPPDSPIHENLDDDETSFQYKFDVEPKKEEITVEGVPGDSEVRAHKCVGYQPCSAEFKQRSDLKRHIASVHDKTKPHKCPTCGGGFSSKQHMRTHIATVHEGKKPYACGQCGASFAHKGNLNGHIASVHEGKKPYVCKICDTKFAAKQGLQKHISTVHAEILPLNFGIDAVNDLISADALEIPKELKVKRFKCDFCEASFTQRSDLKRHIATAHEGIKPYQCDICGNSFTSKQ